MANESLLHSCMVYWFISSSLYLHASEKPLAIVDPPCLIEYDDFARVFSLELNYKSQKLPCS